MPGTPFYEEYLSGGANDYWRSYVAGNVSAQSLDFFDTDFSAKEIDKKVKRMYLRFYLRPKVFLPKLFTGNIAVNFLKYSKALLDFLSASI